LYLGLFAFATIINCVGGKKCPHLKKIFEQNKKREEEKIFGVNYCPNN
jgi:hypothetical protein